MGSLHDCNHEETIVNITEKTANVNGKFAVLFIFIVLLVPAGWASVDRVADTANGNRGDIRALVENMENQKESDNRFQREMLKRLDRVLVVVEKIDERVRVIEIKQAEGEKP